MTAAQQKFQETAASASLKGEIAGLLRDGLSLTDGQAARFARVIVEKHLAARDLLVYRNRIITPDDVEKDDLDPDFIAYQVRVSGIEAP
jgi:hypothetical protein